MPWGTEFPTRVRAHRTAWSTELAALPGPPHREVWTSPGAQANAPALTATAELLTPTAKSGVVAKLPATGDSFPHQFPWQFKGPNATMRARAELLPPTVGVGPVPVAAPTLVASAELLAPEVSVTTEDVIVEAPLLTASADMPAADLVAVVEAPLLTASAATNGFPYRFPRSFAPNGFLVPDLVAGASLPTSEATAELLPPAVSVNYSAAAPIATATADVPTPTVSSGAGAAAPLMSASAELLTPTILLPHDPEDATYTTPGTWTWNMPSWCRNGDLVDLIMYAGGRGGTKGTSLGGSNGGAAGAIASTTLEVGTDIALGTSLTGQVGAAGAANSGNGGNTTCTTIGMTAAGATTESGASNGASPGNRTQGTRTVTGGTGGTGSSSGTGGAGTQPGAGGGGGGSLFFVGQNGSAGGAGLVAVRVRRP
ncbi:MULTISPECIES: glycine-rich domain-containing protein [Mycolicibacterium]|jgi:hypothetical protein|uniref:Glycine-rich domain-containing protein n=1 Tax=Mycolicibacterium fortuitum TaxID=1766 RepID=A0AAE4VH44_MYCFO|nr:MULTISPECIES: hypothetical protein [Mycolicibacterium]MDV7194277.1 hypothetical protein [Mycolicibacterium fortuitum]MDV7294304.1 hypothetical protein [Mycolicibacterium fortuitum]MDV7301417.1 hypothetical protein [Mycolicibacterium fortuitum]MDV7323219.1 hypothetical protein [Mycolicibacterium fortuitum]MDV7363531.1 hypothetical protein [Mycolicibacterium fortuitum]